MSRRIPLKAGHIRPSLRVSWHNITKPWIQETCLPQAGRVVARGDQECRGCAAKVYPVEFPGGNPIQQGELSYPGRSVSHAMRSALRELPDRTTGETKVQAYPVAIARCERIIDSNTSRILIAPCRATCRVMRQPPSPFRLWRAREVSSLSGRSLSSEG